jgi:deoxyhypusine synthase
MIKYLINKNKIKPRPLQGSMSINELIDDSFLAYNAGRIREACRLFDQKYSQDDVVIGLSLSGALTPAGLGISCLAPLMKHGLVDWVVSTGANLYHDLHYSLAKSLFRGSPNYDDTDLRNEGIIRIYDIVFDYDVLLSTDNFIRTVCQEKEFQKEMGTAELHYLLGKYALERENQLGVQEQSLLSTAYEYDIPVYTSSPGDSSIGMNIAALALENRGPKIDTNIDVNETAALVYNAKKDGNKSGVIILGGGSPKNYVLQTEPHIQEILGLKEAGHDYFIQVTDARPDTGGLSGATPAEAVSWGKIDPNALPDTVVVYADTTIVLPLITSYVLSKGKKRKPKRLYQERNHMMEGMKKDADI